MSVKPLARLCQMGFWCWSRSKGAAPDGTRAAPWVVCICSCPGPLPWWEGRTTNGPPRGPVSQLLDYLGDDTRADGSTALSNGEPQALVHGDRLDQLDLHLGVLTRGDELA